MNKTEAEGEWGGVFFFSFNEDLNIGLNASHQLHKPSSG